MKRRNFLQTLVAIPLGLFFGSKRTRSIIKKSPFRNEVSKNGITVATLDAIVVESRDIPCGYTVEALLTPEEERQEVLAKGRPGKEVYIW